MRYVLREVLTDRQHFGTVVALGEENCETLHVPDVVLRPLNKLDFDIDNYDFDLLTFLAPDKMCKRNACLFCCDRERTRIALTKGASIANLRGKLIDI